MTERSGHILSGKGVVFAAFVILMIIWGTSATYGVFFESFINDFEWSRASISGASSLKDLLFGIFCITTAWLMDRYGPRAIASACAIVLGTGYLLMSRIENLVYLYGSMGLMISLGMSAYIPLLSVIARWYDKRRGMVTGLVLSGMGVGTMVFPPMANKLIQTFSWQTSYVWIGAISLAIFLLAAQFLRQAPNVKSRFSNSVPSSVASQNHEGFTLRSAVRELQFWQICLLYFCFLYSLLSVLVHIVIHTTGLGISSGDAATMLTIIGAFCIVGMNLMGITADRIGNKKTLTVNFLLMALSFLLFVLVHYLVPLYVSAALFGLAYGGIQVLFSPTVAELFGLKSHGVILSTAAFAGTIGAALGPVITGSVFDISSSYTIAFLVCGILSVIGMINSLWLRPVKIKK